MKNNKAVKSVCNGDFISIYPLPMLKIHIRKALWVIIQ